MLYLYNECGGISLKRIQRLNNKGVSVPELAADGLNIGTAKIQGGRPAEMFYVGTEAIGESGVEG